MNTTAAATEANVTVATIRSWCRKGVIAATKTAGKWVIDAASLARRLTIGALKRPAKARKSVPMSRISTNPHHLADQLDGAAGPGCNASRVRAALEAQEGPERAREIWAKVMKIRAAMESGEWDGPC